LAGIEVALGGELLKGRRDDTARDPELAGQTTAGGQRRPGAKPSGANSVAQCAFELLVQRQIVVAVERHEQVNWPCVMLHNWNCTRVQ
jgi:hypothetical protein